MESGRSVSVPVQGDRELGKAIVIKRHQIVNGFYRGSFGLPAEWRVVSVTVSSGRIDAADAARVDRSAWESGSEDCSFSCPVGTGWGIDDLSIHFEREGGEVVVLDNVGATFRQREEAYVLAESFFRWMEDSPVALSVLEIGSRARSGITRRGRVSARHGYTGIDVMAGENVDIVADAHRLSEALPAGSIDAVFSIAVFEHLAMPWKVAIELNKVMRVGGRAMLLAPQAWPLHDAPFDFWRYSDQSWRSLFNAATGFRIVDAKLGDPARIYGEVQCGEASGIHRDPGFLVSCVVVEKVSETTLSWDVPLEVVSGSGVYPA